MPGRHCGFKSHRGYNIALEHNMAGKMSNQLAALEARRQQLETGISDARNNLESMMGELRGIDYGIAAIKSGGTPDTASHISSKIEPQQQNARRSRGAVKDIVLELILSNSDSGGLKTTDVVCRAKERGVDLDRNSVGSLLSRLTRDGVLVHDPETRRYRAAPKSGPNLRSVA